MKQIPLNGKVNSRRLSVTAVGGSMLIAFTMLGLGWSRIEWHFSEESEQSCICEDPPVGKVSKESVLEFEIPRQDMVVLTPAEAELERLHEVSRWRTRRALDYSVAGKYRVAAKEAERAIKLYPQNIDAYEIRDSAYKALGIQRKKREIVIRGRVFDADTLRELKISDHERRKMVLKEGLVDRGITDMPMEGL